MTGTERVWRSAQIDYRATRDRAELDVNPAAEDLKKALLTYLSGNEIEKMDLFSVIAIKKLPDHYSTQDKIPTLSPELSALVPLNKDNSSLTKLLKGEPVYKPRGFYMGNENGRVAYNYSYDISEKVLRKFLESIMASKPVFGNPLKKRDEGVLECNIPGFQIRRVAKKVHKESGTEAYGFSYSEDYSVMNYSLERIPLAK